MSCYQAVFRRREVKYLLTRRQLQALRPILAQHMEPDGYPHSSIGNLYYDTPDFRMIRRSLCKPKYKEKLRLRCYRVPGKDTESFLEIKKKASGVVYKRRCALPYAQALAYLRQKGPGGQGQIFRELDWMLRSYQTLEPAMFLSYERDSFRGKEDPQLRLTLDRDILWRTHALDLSLGTWGQPLLEPDQVLMEIKIPNSMPLWLADALSELRIFPVSFSKYGHAYRAMCGEAASEQEVKQYA